MENYLNKGNKKPAEDDLINKIPREMDNVKKGSMKDTSDAFVKNVKASKDKKGYW